MAIYEDVNATIILRWYQENLQGMMSIINERDLTDDELEIFNDVIEKGYDTCKKDFDREISKDQFLGIIEVCNLVYNRDELDV